MTDPARAARLTADPVQLQLDTLCGFDDSFDLTVSLGVLRCLVAEKEQAEQARDAALAALTAIVNYRDRVGPLGFQVEKFDGLLHQARVVLDAALAASAPQKEEK
jgi:hypothetical protein